VESDKDPYPVSVLDRIRELVAKQYNVPVSEITPGTHFYADLDDSLEVVEVVLDCEELFEIGISNEQAARIETVGQLAACVEAALREQKQ